MKQILPLAFCLGLMAAPPLPVIFDTDLGNDIDDALALAILHAFQSRGEVRLLAVTVTKDNPWASRAVAVINRYYGRPEIPIGAVTNGVTKDDGHYNLVIAGAETGTYPPAVAVLRQALEKEADHSVVVVQTGFSTNLAHLLAEPGGKELAGRKVKLLVAMAGNFTKPDFTEYNVKMDVASAKRVFDEWPTPIIASGFEIGERIKFPASSIEHDFPASNPVAAGYKAYMKMPYDRETWDLTAALYAVRPDDGYFLLSAPGHIRVQPRGEVRFEPDPAGPHRYLILHDDQIARIREALIWLASQPRR